MIGKLTGRIDSISGQQIILDVNGVGYLVACSAQTQHMIGQVGDTAVLWIDTHVREDAINLFGFATTVERDWFKLLTSVQGVGTKSALSILGILTPERLAQALASGDKGALTAADGVGPKLAARLVTELKDKVANIVLLPSSKTQTSTANPLPQNSLTDDALSALLHLGYRRMEAFGAIANAANKLGETATLDNLIKTALIELSNIEGRA
ncbi:MAG: Holliday junction branch migration protein RuvA [Proteobacteria bacterium]|jgi:Holliday junction DNA helicase RuvA|nr:Holliday junction branch migration protein RuvA [Alphaproteobacteria bacterium]NCC04016.1 Holliday junction branch migration protein RuvA [Pseudomonadota bacterium]